MLEIKPNLIKNVQILLHLVIHEASFALAQLTVDQCHLSSVKALCVNIQDLLVCENTRL